MNGKNTLAINELILIIINDHMFYYLLIKSVNDIIVDNHKSDQCLINI